MLKNLVWLASVCVLFAGHLFAETGVLQGRVLTDRGAVLSNARITLTDGDKNVVAQSVTGPTGRFSLNVPLGEYELSVNADGFGRWKQMVRVAPGVFDLSVTVVRLPDGIDIRGDALQSNANLDAIVLNESFLRTLSDLDTEFAISLAGTRANGPGMTQTSNPASGSSGGVLAGIGGGAGIGSIGGFGVGGGGFGGGGSIGGVGGVPPRGPLQANPANVGNSALGSTNFVGQSGLSGPRVNFTGPEFIVDGQSGRLPPKDQVREVWIDTNPFTAEYSRPGFGRIHVNPFSTARSLHGSAAFNFRDESMDAQLPNVFSSFRPRYQTRYFHGEVGGPLIPSKLFASLSAQRLGADNGRTVVGAVTPGGTVGQEVNTGWADQIFNGRSQYQISERHQLNVNGRYRSEVFPNVGVGGANLPEQGSTQTLRGWDINLREVARLGSNVVHETRLQVRRDTSASVPVKEGTTNTVFFEFTGGGTSSRSAYRDTQIQIENLVVWATPQATLRMGVQGYRIERSTHSRGSALGTYYFSSLSDYLAGLPFSYSQSPGEVNRDIGQTEGSVFAQAEWHASKRFSLSGGLRYEAQANLDDRNNLDPRIAFAYRAAPQIVLRGGLGVFHQRLTIDDASLLEREDGSVVPLSVYISNPSYPNPGPIPPAASSYRNSIVLRDPELAAPYLEVGSLSLEKWFDKGFLASVTVDVVRGMRQFRTRNVDAPFLRDVDPATLTADEVDQLRPFYPLVGFVNQYESVGFLKSKNLSLRGRTPELRVWRFGVKFNGDYTLLWSEDDDGIPVDNYDRRAEWGRTSQIARHNFWSGAIVRAPWRISFAALSLAHSGYPYSITQSTDLNRDGNFAERAPGVRKNASDGPNYFNLDLKLSKGISLPGVEATLFAYGQNVFNSRNYAIIGGSSTSIGGGLYMGGGSARRMELGVRLQF